MYYPKSQIKENLYTNGGEYVIKSTNKEYKGYYYSTSNGNAFTGRNPNDGIPLQLIPFPIDVNISSQDNFNISIGVKFPTLITSVNSLRTLEYKPNENPQQRVLPSYSLTVPTLPEQELGVFTRYFCKKTNELKYIEINKETYTQLKDKNPKIAFDLYLPQQIIWQIKGDKEKHF
jgi:hypothetical protein